MRRSAGAWTPLPFLESLPAGDDRVSAMFLWYLARVDVEFEAFEKALKSTGRTVTVYGRQYVTGVNRKAIVESIR